MGSIYNKYVKLKEKDEKYLYLFKSGNFYIFLDEDAIEVSRVTLLKLTNYSNDIYKCGFPVSSIDKYNIAILINKSIYVVIHCFTQFVKPFSFFDDIYDIIGIGAINSKNINCTILAPVAIVYVKNIHNATTPTAKQKNPIPIPVIVVSYI